MADFGDQLHFLKCVKLLAKVLMLIDGDAKPAMPYIYAATTLIFKVVLLKLYSKYM